MNRLVGVVAGIGLSLVPEASLSAAVVSFRPSDHLATFGIEGLYDMVGLGSWNGQPVSETNQPSLSQRRLAADVAFFRDAASPQGLWITVTNIVTTQGSWWSGAAAHAVLLTGLGIDFATGTGHASATAYSGEYGLAGQAILTSSGSTPTEVTPGYGLWQEADATWIRCVTGTEYAMSNFGWVSGLTVLTGSAVFRLTMDREVDLIDWNSTTLTGRYGVDHQFVEGTLALVGPIPGPTGVLALLLGSCPRRRRRW